jgi:hypothetical protein
MPRPSGVGQICEWRDCAALASRSVSAQWTVVDFVRYEACAAHVGELWDWLGRKLVYGSYPVDMWVTYYGFGYEVHGHGTW